MKNIMTIQYGLESEEKKEKREKERRRVTTRVKECMRELYQPNKHRVFFKIGFSIYFNFDRILILKCIA